MTSFDALVYPCDKYVWYATFSMALAMFFALVVIQKTWLHATGEKQPNGWIFQGMYMTIFVEAKNQCISVSDLLLSLTPFIDESMPWTFYNRVVLGGSF